MRVGDVIVYADGTKDRIVGFPDVNGQLGLMVKPIRRKPLMAGDVFKTRSEVQKWVNLGIWKIEERKR